MLRLRTARVTRSGPELRRRVSKGTNVNPFTPRELSSRAKRKAGASSIDNRYVLICGPQGSSG